MMRTKGKLMLAVIACIPAVLHAQSQDFVINGKLSKKAKAYKAYILYDDNNKAVGSIQLKWLMENSSLQERSMMVAVQNW